MKFANNVIELVGKTPLVKINKITKDFNCLVLAKLEFYNPLSSVKDRISVAMIEDARKKGLIKKDTVIIEPTSGNTGIGLAFVCAVYGYKLIITMPDTMSIERRKLLKAFGAEVVLTPGSEGMPGAVKKAKEIFSETPNSFMPQQFENPVNPEIHKLITAQEIWQDTDGKIDIFISGIGTGGTITGVSEFLKQKKPGVKIVGVEPFDSPVISGGKPGIHKIQGIGAGFIPGVLKRENLNEIIKVKDEDAKDMTRRLIKEEGIFCGISSGAAMCGVMEVLKNSENQNKTIVVIFPDTAERYLSTYLFEDI